MKIAMQPSHRSVMLAAASAALLLNACAPTAPMVRPDGQPSVDTQCRESRQSLFLKGLLPGRVLTPWRMSLAISRCRWSR